MNLGHVFRFRIVSRMWTWTYGWKCKSETRVPSSRRLVKQYNQKLCISSYSRCFTMRLQLRLLNWLRIKHYVPFFHNKCPIFDKKRRKLIYTPDINPVHVSLKIKLFAFCKLWFFWEKDVSNYDKLSTWYI